MTDHEHLMKEAESVVASLRSLLQALAAGLDDPAVELPLAQLRVCNLLLGGPRSMSAIGKELGVSLSAVTQIADRLERAGLAARAARGADRRVRCLELTRRGQTMMQFHDDARLQRASAALERLSPKQRRQVAAALQTLIGAAATTKKPSGNRNKNVSQFSKSEVLL